MAGATHEAGDASSQASAAPTPARRPTVAKALAVTLAGQVTVALGTVLLYRLLALNTGAEGFAAFALVRQAVNLAFPVATVGLVGGLPRYLALRGPGSPPAASYLVAAAVISGAVTLACAACAVVAPGTFSTLAFGDGDHTGLVAPFVALLAATSCFYLAYGWFRGRLEMVRANAVQIIGMGLVPPALVWLVPDIGPDEVVLGMAAALAGISLAAVARPLARGVRTPRRDLRHAGHELFDYGSRRVPGELAQVGLFALVPILAAHVGTRTDVAFLAAGLQVVTMTAVGLGPLGVVLLPALARLWAEDPAAARAQVSRLSAVVVHIALFAGPQMVVFADVIVRVWLGDGFAAAGSVVQVTVLCLPVFAYYLAMRSALDAAAVRSYNSRSSIQGLIAFGVVAAVLIGTEALDPVFAVAWAFSAGLAVQGLSTVVFVRRVFRPRLADHALAVAVTAALLCAVAALLLEPVVEEAPSPLAALIGVQALLAAAYLAVLWRFGVRWLREGTRRLSARRAAQRR